MTILWWWCCTGSWHHLLGWRSVLALHFDPQSPPYLLQLLLDLLFGLCVVIKGRDLPAFELLGNSECILHELVHLFHFFGNGFLRRLFRLIWQFETVLQVLIHRYPLTIGLFFGFWVLQPSRWRRSYWRHWAFKSLIFRDSSTQGYGVGVALQAGTIFTIRSFLDIFRTQSSCTRNTFLSSREIKLCSVGYSQLLLLVSLCNTGTQPGH